MDQIGQTGFGFLKDIRPDTVSLADRFLVPPFTLLDTRAGYWRDRRSDWLALGLQSELGRGLQAGGGNHRSSYGAYSPNYAPPDRRKADQQSNVTGAPAKPDWATGTGTENMAPGTSIFDPVLCELAYRWFCPPAGHVLDPFAGGGTVGVVSQQLKRNAFLIDVKLEYCELAAQRCGIIKS
ncbi:hypothetical protein LCGC14_2619710 [marine sediment metagenome]|uniref:DNA methylase N-4/N-6 domain-containing protein n=1 Tax=marine sediment metagenome TaxID=412755 RepID=A0A0F9A3D3_9ZZZZ